MFTQSRLVELLDYDPQTGIFKFKPRPRSYFKSEGQYKIWHKRFCNKPIKTRNQLGYIEFCLDYKLVKAHRIAWIYVYGETPDEIDHINHVRDDNRILNLRNVSSLTNSRNRAIAKNNKSGVNGVNWYPKYGKWVARLGNFYGRTFLGYHDTVEQAAEAIASAKQRLGYHENHGD